MVVQARAARWLTHTDTRTHAVFNARLENLRHMYDDLRSIKASEKLGVLLARLLHKRIFYLLVCLFQVGCRGAGGGDVWPLDRPEGMTQIQSLEVMCGKDHMDVHLSFTQPFEGIVFSKGQYGDPRCVYVHPSTGRTFFSFRIAYARCGTKPDLHGQFYENTVVVQYDKDLLEVWDEAKRLRCEWFNDYEKTASKPPMVIADLDVIQLDFRGNGFLITYLQRPIVILLFYRR